LIIWAKVELKKPVTAWNFAEASIKLASAFLPPKFRESEICGAGKDLL